MLIREIMKVRYFIFCSFLELDYSSFSFSGSIRRNFSKKVDFLTVPLLSSLSRFVSCCAVLIRLYSPIRTIYSEEKILSARSPLSRIGGFLLFVGVSSSRFRAPSLLTILENGNYQLQELGLSSSSRLAQDRVSLRLNPFSIYNAVLMRHPCSQAKVSNVRRTESIKKALSMLTLRRSAIEPFNTQIIF